ncbi:MAG: hypothetical protein HN459_10020 [Candidatus Marinimicrobia bacterium]|nr:hypothetical protein [Candidatus Neomarinimicrobiota bacterium]
MQVRDATTTYRIMSAVKSSNTKPEKLLGQAMWKLELRYRKQHKILGKPDYVFLRTKIPGFCDGDFWHLLSPQFIKWRKNYTSTTNRAGFVVTPQVPSPP